AWAETLRNALSNGLWQKQEVSKHPLLYQPLSTLLPELQNVLSPVDLAASLSPEQEQLRLWEATLELLTTISERTPLLIVLDDFHWADDSSYELFTYLVRRLHGRAIAFIATYRENELPAKHPLRSLLIDLQREKVALSLLLAPLSDEQIAALVAHLPQPVVQHIQTQAAGNPFFAEELARVSPALIAENTSPVPSALSIETYALPETIAAVLTLRIERLSPDSQRLLNTVAVLGGSFEFQVVRLLDTSGGGLANEDTILDRIEEIMASGLLIEEGSGTYIRYTLWHPLLVKHLYERLSAARRANLHRRVANVLQQIYARREEEGAATITTHLVAGGADPQQIAHYAELAADSAYALSAYPEADHYYRLAIEHRDPPQTLEPDQRLHLAYLLERRAECTRVQGNDEEARHLYERVLTIRNLQATHADNQYEAQIDALLWCEIGHTWYDLGDNEQARQCYEQGKQVLQHADIDEGPAWAMLHLHQSYSYWREGNYDNAYHEANEALSLFENTLQQSEKLTSGNITGLTSTGRTLVGDQVNLGRTHVLLGLIAATEGQPGAALAHLNAALTLFELYNYQREVANVSCDIGDVYLRKSEHELAQSFFRRSLHLAEQVGDIPLMSVVFCSLGELAERSGELREAENLFKQSCTFAEQVNDQIYVSLWNVYLAAVLQVQGKIPEAKACIQRALILGRSMHNEPCIGFALIALGQMRLVQALMLQNESDFIDEQKRKRYLFSAQRNVERALALEGLEVEIRNEGQLTLAKVYLLLGNLERAQQEALSAFENAGQYELISIQARTQSLLGSILAAQGKLEEAKAAFDEAIAVFQKYEMRLEYARALYQYGTAIVRQKRIPKKRYVEGMGYLHKALEILKECSALLDIQFVEGVLKGL
ncbi:MAG: tetratricopeptide repeat protein, partial [Chloroflexota bacterium]|nr:tetratricopeptide repeat protein [Chloroflexota bacterium]